jgi:putative PIN family toxin of toxin-antitoxin system
MIRSVVFDTNTVISGFLWSGPPMQILEMAKRKEFLVVSSPFLFAELERVLFFPRITKRLKALRVMPQEVLAEYRKFVSLVLPNKNDHVIIKEHPIDDAVVLTAIAADAQYIVSGDKHLLNLGSYRNINIVSPSEFLKIIKKT